MPYVLDTGVLLRLFDCSDPSHVAIRQAVIRLKVRGERLVTTAQNIAEFWNVSTRRPTALGGYGLPVEKVVRHTEVSGKYLWRDGWEDCTTWASV